MHGYRVAGTEPASFHLVPHSVAERTPSVSYIITDPNVQDYAEKIYFDRKTGYLLQMSYFDKDDKGVWNETRRDEFQFWDFNVHFPAETFSVRPMRTYLLKEELNKLYHTPTDSTKSK